MCIMQVCLHMKIKIYLVSVMCLKFTIVFYELYIFLAHFNSNRRKLPKTNLSQTRFWSKFAWRIHFSFVNGALHFLRCTISHSQHPLWRNTSGVGTCHTVQHSLWSNWHICVSWLAHECCGRWRNGPRQLHLSDSKHADDSTTAGDATVPGGDQRSHVTTPIPGVWRFCPCE